MKVTWVGSKYGGWWCVPELVPKDSLVISAGLGNDFSFDEDLIKLRQCRIIGIDPTTLTVVSLQKLQEAGRLCEPEFKYIRAALWSSDEGVEMPDARSNGASIYRPNSNVTRHFPSVSLVGMFVADANISLVKMNIEGAEYDVLRQTPDTVLQRARQYLIRFHHRVPGVNKSVTDSFGVTKRFIDLGYKLAYEGDPTSADRDYEVTVCKV